MVDIFTFDFLVSYAKNYAAIYSKVDMVWIPMFLKSLGDHFNERRLIFNGVFMSSVPFLGIYASLQNVELKIDSLHWSFKTLKFCRLEKEGPS